MNHNSEPDRQFHDNLRALGRELGADAKPSQQTLDRCRAAFDRAERGERRRMLTMMKRPAFLSITGIAAAAAVCIVLFFPGGNTPRVQAATILRQLDAQMSGNPTIEIRFDRFSIDNVNLDGFLKLSEAGIGGDLQIRVEEDEGLIEVDAAMGLRPKDSWMLLRKISIPDPEVQPLLMMFFPEGLETVLLLPQDMGDEMTFDVGAEIGELQSEDLLTILREIIATHDEIGAELDTLEDGKIRLTLPIEDAEALATLKAFVPQDEMKLNASLAIGKGGDEEGLREVQGISSSGGIAAVVGGQAYAAGSEDSDSSGDEILIGSTLSAVYDPGTERVLSFEIRDLGSEGSSLLIDLESESPTEGWLDWEAWVSSTPRVLDLNALSSMFETTIEIEEDE